jgi:hypothetical protein
MASEIADESPVLDDWIELAVPWRFTTEAPRRLATPLAPSIRRQTIRMAVYKGSRSRDFTAESCH